MRAGLSFLALSLMSFAAAAAEAPVAQPPSAIGQGLMLGGFIAIFYFLIWRPQSKRAKEHRELVGGLGKGDEIVTSGGMVGKVTEVSEQFIKIAIADNLEIQLQKQAVVQVLPKGTLKSL